MFLQCFCLGFLNSFVGLIRGMGNRNIHCFAFLSPNAALSPDIGHMSPALWEAIMYIFWSWQWIFFFHRTVHTHKPLYSFKDVLLLWYSTWKVNQSSRFLFLKPKRFVIPAKISGDWFTTTCTRMQCRNWKRFCFFLIFDALLSEFFFFFHLNTQVNPTSSRLLS